MRDILANNLEKNFMILKSTYGEDFGLITKKYFISGGNIACGIAYLEQITDVSILGSQIISPLLEASIAEGTPVKKIINIILTNIIKIPNGFILKDIEEINNRLLTGYTVVMFEGLREMLLFNTGKREQKIEKPQNEVNLFGSKEAFTDNIDTNYAMILKRLPITGLKTEAFIAGKYSKTRIKLIWIKEVCPKKFILEARKRLKKINVEHIDGAGMLVEMISDNPITVFPLSNQTERVDKTVRCLSSGRFAIIIDNSPYAVIAPYTFWDNFKSIDDYIQSTFIGSFMRITRLVSFFISTVISSVYLSFVAYNQIIIPPELAVNIAVGRQDVPFPSIVELILLTFVIGIIREAGMRMPGLSGYFVGALGAIIIGQAAVDAGYVSASLIIVIAVSAISSFAISVTAMVNTSSLINYFLILFSGFFGMFGLASAMILVYWHMINLKSFGIPYLYPLVPFEKKGMKDIFIRLPLSKINRQLNFFRPSYYRRKREK